MITRIVPDNLPAGMSTLPRAAAGLIDAAERAGWLGVIQFVNIESAGGPFVSIGLVRPGGRGYKITWHSRATGGKSYRLFSKIVREQPGGGWRDAPSVIAIVQYIIDNPVERGQTS